MIKKEYAQINETLYTEVLPNGLKVYLLPKMGFHKTYGLFTTNYGSIDNYFGYENEALHQVPDGIAHFLEHKMFEKEEGDVFQIFGQQGASANAFTSFTRTSYLFSATDRIKDNLVTLLDFVQAPYFTKETVEKEKGIIGQEIQMYDDDPNWRQFFGMLRNLYPNHPVGIDIAGTVESIADITAEDLYLCYHTFYHPSNMTLFIVGNIDVEEVMQWVRDNQAAKTFAPIRPIERIFPEDSYDTIKPYDQLAMPISRPKTVLGIKGLQQKLPSDAKEKMIFRSALHLLFQMLLGNTSANFLRLYNQGIIDDTFGFEFNLDRAFHFADFSTDTDDPATFEKEIRAILLNYRQDPEVNEANLALLKKKTLGKYFQSLNSLEHIANQFTQDLFGEYTLFDMPEIIQSLTLADLYRAAEVFIVPQAFSRFDLIPLVTAENAE
ncbi:EF-P 5-aminopentanol modification-associated protein YfmH [Enterococcus columbae]|uniref:M16 family peptidase n=1 Tax=Enterococcus columbae DSM 7374 = ATCC 51263 TaxID=1121865 RepID=S0KG17_9ENTE|nr:pitrilysin family protein [Enterococcus columbae]EOT39103.1 M16 family peptidase [Enterococcus columbae DSM 7374 = ATCC 51263]EOW79964.1 M16 family peptidase [Enterococcus columbae DSM 7374 = ATCC 51263]